MGWIKYDKECPQQDGRYQIFVKDYGQFTADYKCKFGFCSAEDDCAYIQDQITHWMPLPEPPKE